MTTMKMPMDEKESDNGMVDSTVVTSCRSRHSEWQDDDSGRVLVDVVANSTAASNKMLMPQREAPPKITCPSSTRDGVMARWVA